MNHRQPQAINSTGGAINTSTHQRINNNYERNMDVPTAFGFYRFAAYVAGKPEAGAAEGYKRGALGLSGALRGFESIN